MAVKVTVHAPKQRTLTATVSSLSAAVNETSTVLEK